MNWKHWLVVAAVLLSTCVTTSAQAPKSQPHTARILRNNDILLMVRSGMESHLIIAKIMASRCNFDIFPPVLDDLRRRGVPENVLHFMSVLPNGPSNLPEPGASSAESSIKTATVKLPRGLPITVETLYPISSAKFKVNNSVAFSVARAVVIDGVLVIPRGTIARAKIVRAEKAKSWGRGGALTLEMEYIIGVDGTRIPVQLTAAAEGGNRAGVLAVGAAATSALIFPYTAPVAIVWGLKKGDDAVVRGSREFAAIIKDDTAITGLLPGSDRIIYHYAETLKAKQNSSSTPANFPRLEVRH
ncbi:MAG TPA: hypothetical protein VJ875_16130 [Pyrinomonadaceae bacterium]|nr:hypothetical protein [Pyrinomonadaceae bacterium]